MSVPRHSFLQPWNDSDRCVLEVDGTVFVVKRLDAAPPWPTEFRAYYGEGPAVAKAGKFTTLLRKLERWPADGA